MRRSLALLFICGALAAPVAASASGARPPLDPTKCPSGSSTEVSGAKKTTFTQKTNAAQAKAFLQAALYCPNACYDLTATLTLTYSGLDVTVTGTNKCSSSSKAPNDPSQSPPRGCSSALQQPQVTLITQQIYSNTIGFNVPDQTITKSRCDSNALQTSMTGFFSGLSQVMSNPQGAQAQMISSLNQLQSAPPTITATPALTTQSAAQIAQNALQNPQNQSLMTQALVNLGATQAQAQSVVNGDPENVQKLLTDVAAGNTTAVRTDATTLNLNPSLAGNAVSLNAGQSVGNSTGVVVGTAVPIASANTDVGATTLTPGGAVLSPQGGSWMSGISSAIGSLFAPLVQFIRQSLFSSSGVGTSPAISAQQTPQQQPLSITPAATILVQPSTVKVGQHIAVSWSSVGMSSCSITENSIQLAQGLNGSYSVAASTTGTILFVESCTAQSGTVTRSATSSVQ